MHVRFLKSDTLNVCSEHNRQVDIYDVLKNHLWKIRICFCANTHFNMRKLSNVAAWWSFFVWATHSSPMFIGVSFPLTLWPLGRFQMSFWGIFWIAWTREALRDFEIALWASRSLSWHGKLVRNCSYAEGRNLFRTGCTRKILFNIYSMPKRLIF